MERRRWAHGHISAFTSCAMVGRSLFFLTLESYFAFCSEKVGYQCFLQSKILSLISNYNIFSIEFRAGPEMNKILKSTFFHATFHIVEIRHCPWKAVTVLTIRRNQERVMLWNWRKYSDWPSNITLKFLDSDPLDWQHWSSDQISNSILWWNHTLTSASPDVLCYSLNIITICFKNHLFMFQSGAASNLKMTIIWENQVSVLSSRLWGPCIIIPELWLLQINKTICWHDQVAGARSCMGQ